MKRFLTAAAIVAMAAGLTLNTASAAPAQNDERGYVSASASANKELTPDTAEISISVITTDNKSMQKATLQNKEISDKVYSALKSMINTENGDYVKTSNFRANPLYIYSGSKRNFDKYEVSNTIVVHTKSIDKAGSMIDKAISMGATDISNLSFSVSKYEHECSNLLGLATKKARTQADAVAKSVGSSIAGIKSVNASCNPSGSTRVMYNLMNKSAMDSAVPETAGASTPIEVGVVRIYANVNASFFVK